VDRDSLRLSKSLFRLGRGVSRPIDCGSSLYTELEVMPDMVCIKAGGIDDKRVRDISKMGVEFYTKDRMGYQSAVHGADQKPVFI